MGVLSRIPFKFRILGWVVLGLLVAMAAVAIWAGSTGTARSTASAGRQTGPSAGRLLAEIAADLAPAAKAARQVLLGSRDPNGPSCIREPDAKTVLVRPRNLLEDPNGGAGSRMMVLLMSDALQEGRSKTAQYRFCQDALRRRLADELADIGPVLSRLETLHAKAAALAKGVADWDRWPEGFEAGAVVVSGDWAGHCLRSVHQAVTNRDLQATRRWSAELASVTFALADLHRWMAFLLDNQRFALDMQARCQCLFDWVDRVDKAEGRPGHVKGTGDCYPGLSTLDPLVDNLFEVERQAERLFRAPQNTWKTGSTDLSAVPAAVWVPPDLRKSFVFLRSKLRPGKQVLWDRLAATPFERSYLTNMLFRLSGSGAIEQAGLVLQRCDQDHPQATAASLMGALFYRGAISAGFRWADRYDKRLMKAAAGMSGGREKTLNDARAYVNNLLGNWGNFQGGIWTLREAIDRRLLDCMRGTDMVGSLYRNTGHGGCFFVRLWGGLAAHSVAGVRPESGDGNRIVLADSLTRTTETLLWPQAYFHGLTWPEGYPGIRPPIVAAGLYVRGLDNFVLAEAYIVRGPHAGTLMRTAIPYLHRRQSPGERKVYAGPYPEIPVAR